MSVQTSEGAYIAGDESPMCGQFLCCAAWLLGVVWLFGV